MPGARASKGKGAFPASDNDPAIPAEAWQLPAPSGMSYLYRPGRKIGEAGAILAFEPGYYGRLRYVLYADGEIRVIDLDELRETLQSEAR